MSTGLVRTAHTRRRRALLLSLCALAATGMGGAQARQRQPIGERNVAVRPAVSELPAPAKRYALIVGVDTYADAQIGALGGAANDARLLASTLVERAGFPAEQVVLLASGEPPERQPTRGQILRRLSNLVGVVPRDGLLLFSFAGHGVERGGRAFLLPSDAQLNGDVELLEQTAVEAAWVRKRIEAAGVHQVLMLLDACRNDPAAGRSGGGSVLTETYRRAFNFELRNRGVEAFATIYATAVGGRAYEYKEKGHGYFTWALVEGLRGGAADARGEVTLSGLVKYVQERVPRRVALDLGPGRDQRPFADISGYRADELVVAIAGQTAESPPKPAPQSGVVAALPSETGKANAVEAARPMAPAPSRLGERAGKILLLFESEAKVAKKEAPFYGYIESALVKKLSARGLSVAYNYPTCREAGCIGDSEARRYTGLLRKARRGDRKAGASIPFALVLTGTIRVTAPPEPYQGMYVAYADGLISAIDPTNGRVIATENVSEVRGFGLDAWRANGNALMNVGESLSAEFIDKVLAAAR